MRITLLSARSLRSQAYSVTLARRPELEVSVVEYGTGSPSHLAFPIKTSTSWDPMPDWLRVDWSDAYAEFVASREIHRTKESLNSFSVQRLLACSEPDLVIFAGSAGNIVDRNLLEIAPFLHMHPGKLPDFRGSTTIYWSMLLKKPITVSAILLNEAIDQGDVVADRDFQYPSDASFVDSIYDAGIRTVLLDDVLHDPIILASATEQHHGGRDYFIIHPVLKNITLANLSRREIEPG